MFGLKKYLPLDLVQLTIMLSLLRLDPEAYLELEAYRRGNGMMMEVSDVVLDSSTSFLRTHFHNIPGNFDERFTYPYSKSLDNMLLSQSDIFHQLNMLGRYNRYPTRNTDFTTYLLDGQVSNNHAVHRPQDDDNIILNNNDSSEENEVAAVNEIVIDEIRESELELLVREESEETKEVVKVEDEGLTTTCSASQTLVEDQDISKEDMDLIEILLRQDVDIGVTRDVWEESSDKCKADVINEQTLKVKIKLWRSMFLVLSWWRERGGPPLSTTMPLLYDSSIGIQQQVQQQHSSRSWSDEEDLKAPPLLGCDPWAGLNYTIDSETGEHVVLEDEEVHLTQESRAQSPSKSEEDEEKGEEELPKTGSAVDFCDISDDLGLGLYFDDINLSLVDETTQFESLVEEEKSEDKDQDKELVERGTLEASNSLIEQLKELEEMIQATQLHPHSVHQVQGLAPVRTALQSRVTPFLRSMSMEQRWQDLSNVLAMPPNVSNMSESEMHHHHHHHHLHHHHNMGMGIHLTGSMVAAGGGPNPHPGHHHLSNTNYSIPSYTSIDNRTTVLLQNATLPPPIADLNSNLSYHHNDLGGDSIGAAVVTSMSTLTNGSELLGVDTHPSSGGGYSLDLMFPNGNHSENNSNNVSSAVGSNGTSTDGFLSAMINEDELQLMEMAMTDGGDPLNSTSSASFSYFLSNRKLVNGTEGGGSAEADAGHHPVTPHSAMYTTMRMLDNDDAMDTSSDSAVSSMGSSERVPSISDGQEWMETTSEAGEADQRSYYGMECNQTKYRQFSYSYAPGMGPTHRSNGDRGGDIRMPPVAQKKYQLFGKRLTVEQAMGGSPYGTLPHGNAAIPQQPSTPIKYPPNAGDYRYPSTLEGDTGSPNYSNLEGATAPPNNSLHIGGGGSLDSRYNCSIDYDGRASIQSVPSVSLQTNIAPNLEQVQHNHTYQMSPEDEGGLHRPSVRDKMKKKSTLEEHLSRDEKRARNMKIPMTTEEIVNLPMDEFNERLSKYDLTETQLTLIRDIRRRGKNKVAAQNCRKRKLDQIVLLAEEVHEMQRDREMTIREQQSLLSERQLVKDKYAQLYRHVFQSLRDPDGNPYNPYEYSLQQATDGNVILVPRNGTSNGALNGTHNGIVVGSPNMNHLTSTHSMAQDIIADPNKGAKSKRKEDACRKSEM